MFLRRFMYTATPFLVLLLPAWLLVGAIIFGASAWKFVAAIPLAALTFVVLGLLAAMSLTPARARLSKAQPLPESIIWIAIALTVAGMGFYGDSFWTLFGISVALGIALFWTLITRLVHESRARFAETQRMRQPAQSSVDIGELTVIDVTTDRTSSSS